MICRRTLQNKRLNRHSGNRSAARCRALHLGFLFAIPLGVLFAFPNTTIPPVSGRVRDVVTGEAVRGVATSTSKSSFITRFRSRNSLFRFSSEISRVLCNDALRSSRSSLFPSTGKTAWKY